jgi:opacity protein-like surface antigen
MPIPEVAKYGLRVLVAALASPAHAAIVDLAPNGFELQETIHVAAAPAQVYAALVVPQYWWSSQHSFSGNAANMSLDAHAGGCWCETLPDGGSALHLIVVNAVPGKGLRLRGALGPFQSFAVVGVLDWRLETASGGTDVTLDYRLGGYMKGGFGAIAPVADHVLAEQTSRLKQYVETGDAKAPQAEPGRSQGVTPLRMFGSVTR